MSAEKEREREYKREDRSSEAGREPNLLLLALKTQGPKKNPGNQFQDYNILLLIIQYIIINYSQH